MADREKVIKGLECCTSPSPSYCRQCPYKGSPDDYPHCVHNRLQSDALALLKAQEPVAPIFDYDGRDVWRCGNCHRNIFHPTRTDEDENEKNYRRFCFHCGREVKWK